MYMYVCIYIYIYTCIIRVRQDVMVVVNNKEIGCITLEESPMEYTQSSMEKVEDGKGGRWRRVLRSSSSEDRRWGTVSFHNFKSRNFKLSVSNPKSKYVAYVSVLSQILNCQGLGCKLHPVSVRRFPSFRTQPLENLSRYQ